MRVYIINADRVIVVRQRVPAKFHGWPSQPQVIALRRRTAWMPTLRPQHNLTCRRSRSLAATGCADNSATAAAPRP